MHARFASSRFVYHPPSTVLRQYAIARALFSLPLDEKLKYISNTAAGDFRGYKPQSTGSLGTRENGERYNIPKFTPEHERPHPELIREYWDEIQEFSLHIHYRILLPLLRLFAFVLGIDEETLVNIHRYEEPGLEYLRYIIYHPRSGPEDAQANNLWAKGHTDYNTLTFLFHQPVAGLQVLSLTGADGNSKSEWRYVRSSPEAIIVNIADALEYISGGFLKTDKSRLSLIYFARPEANVLMRPLDSPLLERVGMALDEEYVRALEGFTAEDELDRKWVKARIVKDHRFRTGLVDVDERKIIAGVPQQY
ncbi:hypothetical protein BDV19DRAFT_376315 [Aspergillus venezuelensis]